jgi:hypothetical protein
LSESVSHKVPFHRDLDRRRTAEFIAFADVLIIGIVLVTVLIMAGDPRKLLGFPWTIVTVGIGILVFRMVFLLWLSGGIVSLVGFIGKIANEVWKWLAGVIVDSYVPSQWQWVARFERGSTDVIDRHLTTWFFLLVLGILAQMVIVAGAGGMAHSPFREILVATFILGQFRSPTAKAIWSLFFFGIGAAIVTQILYSLVRNYLYDSIEWPGGSYIAPLLLVGFFSTVVMYTTFVAEEQKRGRSSGPDAEMASG